MKKLDIIILQSARNSFTWVGEVSRVTNKDGKDVEKIKKRIKTMVERGVLTENKGEDGYANTYELSSRTDTYF